MHGNVLLALTRPAKVMKSTVIVQDGARATRSARSSSRTSSARSASASRPAATPRLDQRRELAGVELQHRRPRRHRGRPHHQDVGGPRQDDVHHGRQLRRADPPPARGPAAHLVVASPLARRHRPQAGQPRPRLTDRAIAVAMPSTSGCRPDRRRRARGGGARPGRGPHPARRPDVGAAARWRLAAVADVRAPRRRACSPARRAPPRRSRQLDPAVEVALVGRRRRPRRAGAGDRHGRRPAGVDPHRRAHRAELPLPPVRRRHAHPPVRRRGRGRRYRPRLGHPQDHARAARAREGRGAGRGGGQPPGQPLRLGDVQGQPPRACSASPRRVRRGQGRLARPRRARRVRATSSRSPRRSTPAPTRCCSTT